MRRLRFLPTVIALLLVSVPARAQSPVYDLFRDYLDSLRAQAGIPGLAAVIVDTDQIVWEHAYGREDLARNVATRTDTPFHTDGLTEMFTATMVLRCVEEHRLSLDDRVETFRPSSAEPNATIRQLLTHTDDKRTFVYRPERLEPLWAAVGACTEKSFRETFATLLESLAMVDSVPGADTISLQPPAEGIPHPDEVAQYSGVLRRLAIPYAVDSKGRASVSQYSTTSLTPSTGLISTALDLAKFDLALRQYRLITRETLDAAWRAPIGAGNQPLPHGMGWFVQPYNGETIAWQFGLDEGAASSLMITLPSRGVTLILLANGDRLVKPLPLAVGDVTVSPFARLFLSLFAR
jgi:CubicO group peptidase (beta-lactamase class C family)